MVTTIGCDNIRRSFRIVEKLRHLALACRLSERGNKRQHGIGPVLEQHAL